MVGIYKITNRVNGRVFVGKSENIAEMFKNCRQQRPSVRKFPVTNEIRSYGVEKFDFDVLEECSIQQLEEKEDYYLKIFGIKESGYGSDAVAGSGFIGVSSMRKPSGKGRKNNPNVGIGLKRHIHKMRNDPEYRAQMVEKYKRNRPNAIPIDMINKETNEILMSFPKIMDGAKWIRENTKYTKADYSTINKICKGSGRTAYGYKWQYTKNRKD